MADKKFVIDINNFTPEYVDLLIANQDAMQIVHDKAQRVIFYLNALTAWRNDAEQRAANGLPPQPRPTPPDGLMAPPDPTPPPSPLPQIPPGTQHIGHITVSGDYDATGDMSPLGTKATAPDGTPVVRSERDTPFGKAPVWSPIK